MMNDDLWKEFAFEVYKTKPVSFQEKVLLNKCRAEEIFGWSSSFNDVLPISKATDGNLRQPATSDL